MFEQKDFANKFAGLLKCFPPLEHPVTFFMRRCLNGAHYFMPCCEILKENTDMEELQPVLRLPYKEMAVLTHPRLGIGETQSAYSVIMCFAEESNSVYELGLEHGWKKSDRLILATQSISTDLSLVEPEVNRELRQRGFMNHEWLFLAGIVIFNPDHRMHAMKKDLWLEGESKPAFGNVRIAPMASADGTNGIAEIRHVIATLCTLLSLKNVSTEEHFPDEKLNQRRIRSNVLPLKSFHTLVVNGERWLSQDSNNRGTGSGVRSHLRCGHLRRLPHSEDRIWINQTFVHGSRPGFVSKNYSIKPPEKT